jgi:uncharacterized membrane protein
VAIGSVAIFTSRLLIALACLFRGLFRCLNSPLSLLTQASGGAKMARAMFSAVYGRRRSLPADARPRLYLNGLSLGSFNSDVSFDLYDIIDDPFHGALWVGSDRAGGLD